MKVVLDILRFREDFIPSEDRYEYSLVVALGGELMEIPVSEDQLGTALKDYADLVGEEPEQPPGVNGMGVHYQGHEKFYAEDGETVLHDYAQPTQEQAPYIEGGVLFGSTGEMVPPNDVLTLEDGQQIAAKDFVVAMGHESGYGPAEGAVMPSPQMFQSEEPNPYAGDPDDGLEESLEFDTTGGQVAEGIALDLLGEDSRPMVDEVVVGAEAATQLPNQEPDMSAVFGEAPEPTPKGPRRDMTAGHTKRVAKIKQRIKDRKPANAHQTKLAEMRARAKRHPMRSGAGADEAGNPIVAPKRRAAIPQAPAHVPGQPTVQHRPPTEPVVEDEDGFPSA